MVYFKDISSLGEKCLVISDDERPHMEKDTTLVVYEPLIGGYAKPWPKLTDRPNVDEWSQEVTSNKKSKVWALQSTHHKRTRDLNPLPLPSLGRRIIEGKAKWGDAVEFAGEFHFTKGYWEWTEDILSQCRHELKDAGIYDAVFTSLFTYDRDFELMKAFCEAWCPATNTLLTSFGELSISLWDLHTLVGLPIIGYLYDEVVPSAAELIGMNKVRGLYLPRSCKYLFHAYHLLREDADGRRTSKVTIDRWVQFWSKKAIRYIKPPARVEKKKSGRPKQTHNPLGKLGGLRVWTSSEDALFEKLEINEKLREETYLAAYLSCWLCLFVLPNSDLNLIRPSTFKIASMMATGQTVGLAVPVLASIYKGLNKISNQPRPSRVQSTFPVHFIYGWLAYYFKTHYLAPHGIREPIMATYSGEGSARHFNSDEARKRIQKGDAISICCTTLTKDKGILYVDDVRRSHTPEWNYFMAIRSGHLTLRQGGRFIIEPYSPHRFGRQFRYYQVILGTLTQDIREASLEDGVYYWSLCVLCKSMSRAHLPRTPTNVKRFFTADYKKWWDKVHGEYFVENISSLTNSKPSDVPSKDKELVDEDSPPNGDKTASHVDAAPLEAHCEPQSLEFVREKRKEATHSSKKGSQSTDCNWKRAKRVASSPKSTRDITGDSPNTNEYAHQINKELFGDDYNEESQGSQGSIVGPNSLVGDVTSAKSASEENIPKPMLCPTAVSVFEGKKLVSNHQKKYLQDSWSDLRDKIAKTSIDSISSIQDDVLIVFQSMKVFNSFDLSHIEGLLKVLFEKAATYDEARSSFLETSEDLLAQQLSEAKDRLRDVEAEESKESSQVNSIESELDCVNKKLVKLKKKKKELSVSLKSYQQLLQTARNKADGIREEITTIENTSPSSDKATESLETTKLHLKSAKESLLDLNPFV